MLCAKRVGDRNCSSVRESDWNDNSVEAVDEG